MNPDSWPPRFHWRPAGPWPPPVGWRMIAFGGLPGPSVHGGLPTAAMLCEPVGPDDALARALRSAMPPPENE